MPKLKRTHSRTEFYAFGFNEKVCDTLVARDKQGSGQTPRVTGTGAGRPGNTPDPCIPNPCIPESVTRPVHTRHAGGCVLYNLAGCTSDHTHHTPSLARTTAMKAHEGPQQPTKADEEGKGPKRRVWRRLGHRSVFFLNVFFLDVQLIHENQRRPQQPTKADAGPRRGKTADMYVFFYNVFFKKFTTYSRKLTKAHSNQRRPTKARSSPRKANTGPRRLTAPNDNRYVFFNNVLFFEFTTYSRRPTKTEKKPTRAHSSQRRPTHAHEEGQPD